MKVRKCKCVYKKMFLSKLKYIRVSPKKASFIARRICGLKFSYAIRILEFSNKKFARILSKALKSCVYSCIKSSNINVDLTDLVVSSVCVVKGPVLKKCIFKARGSMSRYLKRTSHVFIKIVKRG